MADDAFNAVPAAHSRCALPILIESIQVTPPYEDDRIVFKCNPYEIRYYNFHHWVAHPGDILTELLRIRLERSGMFPAVSLRFPRSSDYLAIQIRLNALEEKDRNDRWHARLSMGFVLRSADDPKVLWRHSFDTERPVERRTVLGVVETLSAVYNDEMEKTTDSLSDFVSSYSDCLDSP